MSNGLTIKLKKEYLNNGQNKLFLVKYSIRNLLNLLTLTPITQK